MNKPNHGLKRWLKRADGFLMELLFPRGVTCLCCDCAPQVELEDGLCEACASALEELHARQSAFEAKGAYRTLEELSFVCAAFPYEGAAKELIRQLKFERIRRAADPLIPVMALLPSGEEELIVPVPTTKKRLRDRGFNQSLLLAQGVGLALGMPVEDVLERMGEQEAQATLPVGVRLENLHGCMRAKRRLEGMRILLVDDVYTTGATAREAARALCEAGAKSVGVFAAARALPEEERPEFLQNRRWGRREG